MVITITGSNDYVRSRAVHDQIQQFAAEYGDMAVERLQADEVSLDRIAEALTSLPFLSTRKLVVLHQPSANKAFLDRSPELLSGVPESTDVLLVEPKLDKRSRYYKYVKQATDYREYNQLDPLALARWLVAYAKEQGGALSQADANFLVSRVGQNQQLLASELDKLLLYSAHIDRAAITALTDATPQSTIFDLLEAAFSGDARRAQALYAEQRALKVEPQQIVAMLSWQLHIVALIKAAGQRSPETIASEAKVSPYVVKKSLAIARRVTLAKLKQLIADLVLIDARSKRETFAIDDALQHYLLMLAI